MLSTKEEIPKNLQIFAALPLEAKKQLQCLKAHEGLE